MLVLKFRTTGEGSSLSSFFGRVGGAGKGVAFFLRLCYNRSI